MKKLFLIVVCLVTLLFMHINRISDNPKGLHLNT